MIRTRIKNPTKNVAKYSWYSKHGVSIEAGGEIIVEGDPWSSATPVRRKQMEADIKNGRVSIEYESEFFNSQKKNKINKKATKVKNIKQDDKSVKAKDISTLEKEAHTKEEYMFENKAEKRVINIKGDEQEIEEPKKYVNIKGEEVKDNKEVYTFQEYKDKKYPRVKPEEKQESEKPQAPKKTLTPKKKTTPKKTSTKKKTTPARKKTPVKKKVDVVLD